MSTRIKMAFACYVLVGLAGMVFGLRYILSPQLMPYHQEVIGVNWEDLSPRMQKMFLAFLHGAGTSMFLAGLSVLIL